MTIYVPDDLATMVKEHADLNVSAVCQEALRHELARREALAKLGEGMERHEFTIERRNGKVFDAMLDVAFVGKQVYADGEVFAYVTKRGRIAIYDDRTQALDDYDEFAVMGPRNHQVLAAVADALGEKYTLELDI
jgi:hypothetical protein